MSHALVSVWKRYGMRAIALRDINLEIRPREFLVIYGPAGAGKSTMLNILAGITQPTSGDVTRDGASILGVPPERRNAAMAFENYALYSHLSVFDNLAFPLRARRLPETAIASQVQSIAEMMGIAHVLSRRPGFLSGGQRQRVALARAIVRPADLYLLDEPIGHLDAKLRHKVRPELKALAQDRASTVVFTTTSSREALALGDRIAVFNQGRLLQVGTPAEIYHQPVDTFVATFVGDPPMSLIAARAEQEGEALLMKLPDGSSLGAVSRPLDTRSADLKIGFRSSDITLGDPQAPGSITGVVETVEQLGYSVIVLAGTASEQVSITTPFNSRLRPGETVGLRFAPNALHVFASDKAIYHAAGEH
ncbi:MAG: ABC transporter ATP-binding protein [Devosia sp.]